MSIHWFFMVSKCSCAAWFPGFFSRMRAADTTYSPGGGGYEDTELWTKDDEVLVTNIVSDRLSPEE